MSSPLLILMGTMVVNAFLLTAEDTHDSERLADAWRIAIASMLTVTLAAPFMYAVQFALLHYSLHDIDVFVNAAIVAGVALSLTYVARRNFPRLNRSMRSAPLLIVSNGIALATVLRSPSLEPSAIQFCVRAIGISVGFGLLLVGFVALCERIADYDVPPNFRRAPIVFVSAGLVALALMGFTGVL
jgi:electron transport complex protein RnfA